MKQTAVEWLEDEFTKTNHLTEDEFYMKFRQAKEMEKEQMHAEYMRGWKDGLTKQGTPPPPLDRKIYK
jgi:hypothetical protein